MQTEESLEEFKKRRAIIITDDVSGVDRSIIAAPAYGINYETVNLFSSFSGGLVYIAISAKRRRQFQLDLMSDRSALETNRELDMCVSVEAREGVTTGISVSDRMTTLRVLGEKEPNPRKLVKPGHIFPISTKDGGTLVKPGLAEAALDTIKYAKLTDAAAFVDILNKEGEFLPSKEINKFSKKHKLPVIYVSSVIRFRLENEILVEKIAEAQLPSKAAGEVTARAYIDKISGSEHIALISGNIDFKQAVPIRVQRENLIEDLFGGAKSSRQTLQKCLQYMSQIGAGVFVYISRPGSLVKTPQSTQIGHTQAKMMREYGVGAQILSDIGIKKARLLTHTSKNLTGLKSFGIEIVSQEPIPEIRDLINVSENLKEAS